MGRRLHPAAIAVYAVDALRQGAFPLLVILGVSVLGGEFDAQAALRAAGFAVAGTVLATLLGGFRWATTTYGFDDDTVRLRTGLLSVKEVEIPFARVQAVDVEQGPIQRLFGVNKVDVQTGGGGQGGEVVLGALADAEVERLRGLLRRGAPAAALDEEAPPAPERVLSGRRLAVAAATSGQLGVLAPVAAGLSQVFQQFTGDPLAGDDEILGILPTGTLGWVLVAAGLVVLTWLLAALGTVVGFGGFVVRREGDELRIRRGLLQRRQVTLRVARVRAVRVIESPPRQALGFAALRAEVIGHAKERAAAQTLFPLLRRDEVEPFLRELLPEQADALDGLVAPPRRALRRYVLPPLLATAVLAAVAAAALSSPWPLLLAPLGAVYGALGFRAAGWRLEQGRLVVRSRQLARSTVLARAGGRESHDLGQTVFQRRARLADVAVAFGKGTVARIRHVEADDAHSLFAAVGGRSPR
jgi:putative membrane protein